MNPLMKLLFGDWTPPTSGANRKAVNGKTIDEHATMFNQWERQVIEYMNGSEPKTIKQIIDDLHMNTSSVYRVMERLTQRGYLSMTKIYIKDHGKRVKAFVVIKESLKNGNR